MAQYMLLLLLIHVACASMIPGGWKEVVRPTEDKTVTALADRSVNKYEAQSNSEFTSRLVKISAASVQVVAGLKYRLTLEIGQTICRKSGNQSPENCAIESTRSCIITAYVQPWLKHEEITNINCSEATSTNRKRESRSLHLLGEGKTTEPMNDDVMGTAEFSINQLNQQSNSMYSNVLLDVSDAHKQTVAGTKYNIHIVMGQSTCRKTAENLVTSLKQCPLSSPRVIEECTVEVLEQSWNNPRFQLLHSKCTLSKHHKGPLPDSNGFKREVHNMAIHESLEMFETFKQKFGKDYTNLKEEVLRFHTFMSNMAKAAQIQKSEKGSAKYGPTKFADITESEFRKNYLTPEWPLTPDPDMAKAEIPQVDTPAAFDWRDHNAVTGVKNQGSCGSCWAFSTTGNIEGQWAILKKDLLSLSEQELVDCDKVDQGCNGGLPSNAYKAIMKLGGLESEKEYPYEGKGEKCTFAKKEVDAYINSSVVISSDEADMAKWLAKNGPISIGINAFAMQFYMGGVSHPFSFLCNPSSLDHGVLIVGYGVSKGWFGSNPYWIVKNSWGPDWGEKGYYLVYRGEGVCGVNKVPTSAVIKN